MILHRVRQWWKMGGIRGALARRKVVRVSEIQVYGSRTTTFPLESCNAENLRTAARYDRRKASVYKRAAHKQNKRASVEWYEMAADALESLADKLEDGQMVGELPYRKRKTEIQILLRLTTGKAK